MENIPTVRLSKGEVVFKEGDASNSVYLIITGKVEIYREAMRKKVVLATQGPNTIFGEMALIDGKPRSASVVALEPTFCYRCSAIGILSEMRKVDRDIYRAMQNFAAIIRKNNDNILSNDPGIAGEDAVGIIPDEDIKEPYLTKEEIMNNHALLDNVEKLSPFIKSMFRMLMKIAYDRV